MGNSVQVSEERQTKGQGVAVRCRLAQRAERDAPFQYGQWRSEGVWIEDGHDEKEGRMKGGQKDRTPRLALGVQSGMHIYSAHDFVHFILINNLVSSSKKMLKHLTVILILPPRYNELDCSTYFGFIYIA